MHRLEALKTAAQKDLEEMASLGYSQEEPVALKDYQSYLRAIKNLLSFAEGTDLRTKIVQRLVQKVEVLPNSFRIHFWVGKSGLTNGSLSSLPAGQAAPFFVLGFGSNTLTNGRGGEI